MIITVAKDETVMAAETVPSYEFPLSDNDNVMPRIYTVVWFVFENTDATDEKNFMCVDRLKSAMASTLVNYYELAGRLKTLENGGVAVTCDNSGILWQTATSDFSVKDLREINFEQSQLPDGLVNGAPANGELLTVRVTTLTDQSVILGVGMHHSLADATGTFNFIRSWADAARGLEIAKPNRDRNRLLGVSTSSPLSAHPEYALMPENPAPFPTLPPLTAATFLFNRDALDSLKAEALKEVAHLTNQPRLLSTNDALCGLILRCVYRADSVAAQDIKFGMAVNGRSRLNPPLPDNYFGNVNFFAFASISKQKLLASDGLGYAATAVRNSVDHMTNEYMVDALNWIASQENKAKIIPGFSSFFGDDFAATSWVTSPAYETDFGWGTLDVLVPRHKIPRHFIPSTFCPSTFWSRHFGRKPFL
uniref:Uncharacterized protein n=1 Tax=Plectus sambesii TaxID=2011161 RepID=A0A914W7R7_9BILA